MKSLGLNDMNECRPGRVARLVRKLIVSSLRQFQCAWDIGHRMNFDTNLIWIRRLHIPGLSKWIAFCVVLGQAENDRRMLGLWVHVGKSTKGAFLSMKPYALCRRTAFPLILDSNEC